MVYMVLTLEDVKNNKEISIEKNYFNAVKWIKLALKQGLVENLFFKC